MKKILVTGGTGFIGSAIVKNLLKDHKVTVIDNNTRGSIKRLNFNKKNLKFINCDIRDKKKVFKSIKNQDIVIHLAYINGTKYFYSKPHEILDIAIKGLMNVVDGCIKYKVRELVLASSSEVYQTPGKIPTDENEMIKIPDILNPRYSYGGGKILTELVGVNYAKKYFKRLIIFRPHNVYGSDMGKEHVIPELISKIKKLDANKKLVIQGSGNETRSFIHISDFVKALRILMKRGKNCNIYNIGTNEEIRIKTLAKSLLKMMGKKNKIQTSKLKKGSTLRRCPNISKINKIGFTPKISLKNGLQLVLNKNDQIQ
tara:strand:- start:479 stop:1420 length:942 start_codon:yes stop_codon:yes gene_type:complete